MQIHDRPSLKKYRYRVLTKAQLMLTNRATRLEASQGHQTWYILYVRYDFLLVCYSKSVRRSVSEIFDCKNAVTLKTEIDVPSCMVIGNVTIRWSAYDFLLTFYSNYVSVSCRFWDIQCQKISRP